MTKPHPRDSRVQFDAETHTYTIDGSSEGVTSVTTLLADFFPKFDPDTVVETYYNRWQQNPYKKPEYYGKSKEEIKELWRNKGQEAAAQGTKLHAAIEAFYNSETQIDYDTDSLEWKQFLAFQEKHKLVPFKAEMILFSSKHKLGGMLDLLVKNKDGSFSIYDWKRSKKRIYQGEYSWGRYGSGPLCNCRANNYYKYSVQLNLYRELLERYYGYRITSMHVVRFHPDAKEYELVELPRMDNEVNDLLAIRCAHVLAEEDEVDNGDANDTDNTEIDETAALAQSLEALRVA